MAKFGTYGFAPVLWAQEAPGGQRPPRGIIGKSSVVDWRLTGVGPRLCRGGLPRRPISRSSATEYSAPPGPPYALLSLYSIG